MVTRISGRCGKLSNGANDIWGEKSKKITQLARGTSP